MASEKIGRYEIRRELGRGGMATVFLAYDPLFGREVALKVLPKQLSADATFKTRFEREARSIAQLEHSAIVPVYDVGEDAGVPYLVMRYMPGGSLLDRMGHGPMALPTVVRIIRRIATGLDSAHRSGVVHRDVKPANILFDQDDDPYLSDFGIVKVQEASATVTGTGVVGTPAYMSPEQARGDKHIDGRSDIYALGIVLYELVTGRSPYTAETPMQIAMKHILDPVPRLREALPDADPALEQVMARALAKDPNDRYQTAGELAAALGRVAEDAARRTRSVSVAETMIDAPALGETVRPVGQYPPSMTGPTTPPLAATPAKRGGIPLWGWLLGCGGVFVVMAVLVLGGGGALAVLAPSLFPNSTATQVALNLTATREAFRVTQQAVAEEATQAADATAAADIAATEAARVATATALAGPGATATARIEQVDVVRNGAPIYGPLPGRLPHEPDDGNIELDRVYLDIRDFLAEGTFFVPYDTAVGAWDFGILFRYVRGGENYRLAIESDGRWSLNYWTAGEPEVVQEGQLANLNTADGAANDVQLLVQETVGFFWLNGELIAELDLSDRTNVGDVAIGTGMFVDAEVAGEATRYEDFTVWSLPSEVARFAPTATARSGLLSDVTGGVPVFGPESGELVHELDDNQVEVSTAEGFEGENFVVEATFFAPYDVTVGEWDMGYFFRRTSSTAHYFLEVSSDGNWSVRVRTDDAARYLEGGYTPFVRAEVGAANRVALVVQGDVGYFYLNNNYVSEVDLSELRQAGEIQIATGLIVDHEFDGYTTEYEGFRIWELP